jgi:hypothetical protein
MNHSMAVRAHGPQVFDWINHVLTGYLREWSAVMDVNELRQCGPVDRSEVEPADAAPAAVMLNAPATGLRVALVGVHGDCTNGSLDETGRRHLFGQCELGKGNSCRRRCRAVIGLRLGAVGRLRSTIRVRGEAVNSKRSGSLWVQ